MAEHENRQDRLIVAFLMGGIVGALVGVFVAPKPGKQLRSEVREKGSAVFRDAKEVYADASTKAKDIIEDARQRADELKKEADRYLSEARQKAKKILARSEEKETETGQTEEREGGSTSF